MDVKFVRMTPDAEQTMAYVARVSNPKNQGNSNFSGLLRYCIKHKHWSVFEHAFMTLEINTSLAVANQMLRHGSFKFQQFSQRYSESDELGPVPIPELRRQDTENRQNSLDDLDPALVAEMKSRISELFKSSHGLYRMLLSNGVAKECARFVLPQATPTRLYMTGNCRSWIHYLELRTGAETQKEHREVAEAAKSVFCEKFPNVSKALGW